MKKLISVIIVISTIFLCFQTPIVNAKSDWATLINKNGSVDWLDSKYYDFTLKSKTEVKINFESDYPVDFEIYTIDYDTYLDETVFEKTNTDYINNSISLKKGKYTVSISNFDGDDDTVFSLSITAKKATKINFKSKNNKINFGKSKTLSYKTNGYNKKLTWKSSNKKVATVNKNGKVVGKGLGKCKITVKSNYGFSAKTNVIVNNKKIYIFKNSYKSIPKINGKTKKGWKKTNNKISVNKKIKGKCQGESTISKKVKGVTYKAKIYVTDHQKLKKAAKKHIKDILKDPDSLKIYHTYKGYDRQGMPSIVFDYGAKNSYGGYAREYISYSYNDKFKLYYGTYEYMPYLSNKKEI